MSSSLLCIASGGSLLDLDGTFFIQLGIFFVMFFFLRFALFKPVVRMIDARKQATEGTAERAAKTREEAAALLAEVDAKIHEIRTAVAKERNLVIEEARRQERERMAKAQDAAHQQLEAARRELSKKADEVRGQLSAEAVKLADAVASRLLDRAS